MFSVVRLFFIFFILSLLSSTISARSSFVLSGFIKDTTGSPIVNASVTLHFRNNSINLQTKSKSDGKYIFIGISPGKYLLSVEIENFQQIVKDINISEENTVEDLTLEIEKISEQVLVTASGINQTVEETARATTVLSSEEIDRRNETLVSEVLRVVPGLRVNQRGGPGAFTSLRFRGLRVADTSVLVDGLRLRDVSGFRGEFTSVFADLMINNLDRIEVVKGSSGPLYGTAAIGGVVNLISRVGSGSLHGSIGFEGGSLTQLRERFDLAGSLKEKLSYSFGITRTDVNKGLDGNDIFRNTSLATRLAYNWTPNISLSGTFAYSNSPRTNINSSPIPIGPKGNEFGYEIGKGAVVGFLTDLDDPDYRRNSSLLTGWLSFRHNVSKVWSYSISYQGTRTERSFYNGLEQNQLLSDLNLSNFSFDSLYVGRDNLIETRHNLQFGENNLLTVGFEHERESFIQSFEKSSPHPTDRQSSTALFFNDQLFFINRKLQFGLGFRAQNFNVNNPESTPELKDLNVPNAYTGDGSISYYFDTTKTKIRTHVGNSFRAPSLSERFSNIVTSLGKQRIGNPLIRPERALSLDFGVDQNLYKDKIWFSGTYFYSRLQEIISSTAFLKEINVRGGLARGAELEVRATPLRNLDLSGSYTYTRSDFTPPFPVLRSDNTIAPANISRRQQGIPNHQISFGLNYIVSHWNFNFDFTGISNYEEVLVSPNKFQPILFTLKGYKKADIGVSYAFPLRDQMSLRIYTKLDNVFNNHYAEDGFRTPGIVALGGIRLQF